MKDSLAGSVDWLLILLAQVMSAVWASVNFSLERPLKAGQANVVQAWQSHWLHDQILADNATESFLKKMKI